MKTPRIDDLGTHLYIWHCGDESCDCWQPKLSRIYKIDLGSGRYTHKYQHIAEGPFFSEPTKEDWLEIADWYNKNRINADRIQEVSWLLEKNGIERAICRLDKKRSFKKAT